MATNNDTISFEGLEQVSSKRKEWVDLSLEARLQILQELKERLEQHVGYQTLYEQVGKLGCNMMGVPLDTDEGEMEAQGLCLFVLSMYRTCLLGWHEIYEKRLNGTLPDPKSYPVRTAINGQVCVQTFPTLNVSKSGFVSSCKGEVWLDPKVVPSEQDFKPYQYADSEGMAKESGLMVVLGAGNQGGLVLCDTLYGLFTRNCVVYLKLHALRNYMEPLIRSLLEPLIRRGFVGVEPHTTNERAAALVHHPLVTAVHLTGGKETHDGIVWGFDPKEQERNKRNNTPLLMAEMTSELGAVSPWIVVPANYTKAELMSQAGMVAAVIHNNASCNCNAPKVIVLSDSWEQKNEFLEIVEKTLADNILPIPYYPGCAQRWQKFRDQYNRSWSSGRFPGICLS